MDDISKFRAEIHERFIYPLLSPVFTMIALAFILHGQFSRKGNISNIIMAIMAAASFLVLNIVSFDLIKSSAKFTAIPYLNCLVFTLLSIKMLLQNYRQKT